MKRKNDMSALPFFYWGISNGVITNNSYICMILEFVYD